MDWPGNSPNIAPIDNSWAIVKGKLKEIYITTQTNPYLDHLRITMKSIKNACKTLVCSMPKRVNDIILAHGAHIKH